MGRATLQKKPCSPSTQDKSRYPGTSSNVTLRMKSELEGALTPQVHPLEKKAGSKSNLIRGLSPHEQLKRQVEFHYVTQDEA